MKPQLSLSEFIKEYYPTMGLTAAQIKIMRQAEEDSRVITTMGRQCSKTAMRKLIAEYRLKLLEESPKLK
jgi:hypothetical protein